jgi:hypothetical protein
MEDTSGERTANAKLFTLHEHGASWKPWKSTFQNIVEWSENAWLDMPPTTTSEALFGFKAFQSSRVSHQNFQNLMHIPW